jgi:hypothetical protein
MWGASDGTELADGQAGLSFLDDGHILPITGLEFRNNRYLLSGSLDQRVAMWEWSAQAQTLDAAPFGGNGTKVSSGIRIRDIAFPPMSNPSLLLVGGEGGRLGLFLVGTMTQVRDLGGERLHGPPLLVGDVSSVAVTLQPPDTLWITAATCELCLTIWSGPVDNPARIVRRAPRCRQQDLPVGVYVREVALGRYHGHLDLSAGLSLELLDRILHSQLR